MSEIRNVWKDRDFLLTVLSGLLLFGLSIIVYYLSNIYVSTSQVNAVHDLFLDHLPVVNVNFVVNEGVWLYFWFLMVVWFLAPKKIPFTLKAAALFILIRSLFFSITHLGPSPDHAVLNPQDFLTALATGNDLFFSGHTGIPFLISLIFWNSPVVRYVSIIVSIIFGASMLLGHLHYSIDIFGAFFITYTIYHLAVWLFPNSYKLFHESD